MGLLAASRISAHRHQPVSFGGAFPVVPYFVLVCHVKTHIQTGNEQREKGRHAARVPGSEIEPQTAASRSHSLCICLSYKCVSIRALSMKKSARPVASKVSGERGRSEVAGTGKSSAKSAAPLNKVKSNDDLLAGMAGGNPVSKAKKIATVGSSSNNQESKPKTTS
ncbi:hypothetical protein ILYODFUR_000208, partial [Ilyodon furcidens]